MTSLELEERYSRQVLFSGIGREGQSRLAAARVALVGCGATGSALASLLARAGVGGIRIIDRDYVEPSNLQRQSLFDEADAAEALPKAIAAARRISAFNSQIVIEPQVSDLVPANIETLLGGMQLVLDGTDNFETRYLINDLAVKHTIPFCYGGVVGMSGLQMTVRPGETAEDRLVHLVAHEYAHVEQPEGGSETVLVQSLKEGVAELIAELISGSIANSHLPIWVKGREVAIGEAFLAAKDSTKLSAWLYAGVGTPEKPGDLGYWVGYRIAKSYYGRARNKREAIRTLLLLADPDAILRDSGWRPGL